MKTSYLTFNDVKPIAYLYYIEHFSANEISTIQSMDISQVQDSLVFASELIESIFHPKDFKIFYDILTNLLLCDQHFCPLSEAQSNRIYSNIMKIIHKESMS